MTRSSGTLTQMVPSGATVTCGSENTFCSQPSTGKLDSSLPSASKICRRALPLSTT